MALGVGEIVGGEAGGGDSLEDDTRVGGDRRVGRGVVEAKIAPGFSAAMRGLTRSARASSPTGSAASSAASVSASAAKRGAVVRGVAKAGVSAIVLAQERSICMVA